MTAAMSQSAHRQLFVVAGGPAFGVRKRHHTKVIGYKVQNSGRNPPVNPQLL